MPSLTLLGQSVGAGLLAGGLYALLALGLSLSWGLLRLVNLSHFALALLGAYLTYQLGHAFHLAPWLAAGLIVPAFFALGVVLHVVFARFRVTEFTSLLVTFGLAVILESLIQWFWTADYRRYETPWASASIRVGPLFVPTLELLACLTAATLAVATWAWLRFTYVGKALRAAAEDPAMAGAFGVNHRAHAFVLSGISAAYAGVAGAFIALIATLPLVGLPAFYESFLYLVFHWVALATSWSLLSGYAGYFSFGHGAFFGAGMYTVATLTAGLGAPFLAALPVAAVVATLLSLGIGAVVFRVKRLRGELFGLLTLAITFVLATIVLNTRLDGGPGVYLSNVPLPRLVASPTGTFYLLALALATATLIGAHLVTGARLGLGLF